MIRQLLTAFAACCLLASNPAHAQERGEAEAAAVPSPSRHGIAVVQGLAVDDLLNIRATASPIGNVMGRLPNGALVRRHECQVVEGYEWCRVEPIEVEQEVSGWTPARYLRDLEIDAMADVEAVEPASDADQPQGGPDQVIGVPTSPEREPAQAPEASDAAATTKADRLSSGSEASEGPAMPLPPGLEARFAGVPPAATALIGATGTTYLPALRTFLRSLDASDAVETETEAGGAPAAATPATVETTGDIPCARDVGQPMTRCTASVARIGDAAADVTVAWPDGGSRVIEFRDGAPAGSDSQEELRFTREGRLNLIRIGISERFEIMDALPFGD